MYAPMTVPLFLYGLKRCYMRRHLRAQIEARCRRYAKDKLIYTVKEKDLPSGLQ